MRQAIGVADGGGDAILLRIAVSGREYGLSLSRPAAFGLLGLFSALFFVILCSGGWILFRDDMLAALMRRQAQMQFAYEDRIATLRSQIDSLATRQMLSQDTFEGKVAELAVRQARLESRSALVAALAAKADVSRFESPRAEPVEATRRPTPVAPLAAPAAKPAPEGFDLRRAQPEEGQAEDVSENVDPLSPTERLRNLAENFERIERRQIAALDSLRAPAAARAEKLRLAFVEAGLPVDRMIRRAGAVRTEKPGETIAMGGPFEPAPAGSAKVSGPQGGGAFEQAYAGARRSVALMEDLRRALPYAPLRQPLAGPLDITSTYGVRTDPFLGRAALHSGMDLRGETGDPIRATAAGRVTNAGPSGGYGQMVEIDHGAGLATRYGHMSRIDVDVGDWVEAGALVGRVGSTGRSTGPHLHYEVRVDGAAVDPSRYIKAGKLLNAGL